MNLKKIFKNRLIIGLLALLLAVLIIFVINPFFVEKINARVDVFVFASDIERGKKIEKGDIKILSIAGENETDNMLKTEEEILGKYAKTDMYKGDVISTPKLSDMPIKGDEYLYNIPKGKRAISVTITSFAKGLSAKLEKGDIVQIISATDEVTEAPPELKYVYLLSATAPTGLDKDKIEGDKDVDNKDKLPKTATLLVGEEQAKKLAFLEKKESIHIALVFRGDKKEADKLLKEQDDYIKKERDKIEKEKKKLEKEKKAAKEKEEKLAKLSAGEFVEFTEKELATLTDEQRAVYQELKAKEEAAKLAGKVAKLEAGEFIEFSEQELATLTDEQRAVYQALKVKEDSKPKENIETN